MIALPYTAFFGSPYFRDLDKNYHISIIRSFFINFSVNLRFFFGI